MAISIGVIAVTQACCEASLQSSTEQQGSCFALTSAAVHWSCITAHLYEWQISIGVIAVAQTSCESSLQSSIDKQGAALQKLNCPDQCCSALVLHHCTPV